MYRKKNSRGGKMKKRQRKKQVQKRIIAVGAFMLILFVVVLAGIFLKKKYDEKMEEKMRIAQEEERKLQEEKERKAKLQERLNIKIDFDIHSKAAIVKDLQNQKILGALNPEKQIYPASMTKIMTAVVAIEKLKNLDERNQLIIQYINKNQEKLYRLVFSYIKDEEQSLDVIQNTILKALDNLEKLREEKYLETWIYRIAINESLKYIKKQKKEPIFNIQDYEISSEEFENKDITDIMDLYKAIDSLKPKLKTVIILRFFEDKSLAEISKITNSNLSTVKTRLYKALKELKVKIRKDEL